MTLIWSPLTSHQLDHMQRPHMRIQWTESTTLVTVLGRSAEQLTRSSPRPSSDFHIIKQNSTFLDISRHLLTFLEASHYVREMSKSPKSYVSKLNIS